ncbi:PDR/VanB family oxidoreductase [Pseudomonas sp. FP597]|uniref:PDR/VanB family oxidoreductase n=1 Tax=Pseudomonas sp. FP597 TaxID=2954096 RepID=UPI0027329240|nr:PDR/VanB family oxidoreductase [Pseudomonas sp. FP597]WLI04501.1 PDR/VanB family oxidoreductase [Pseudomonas sp. FP597]
MLEVRVSRKVVEADGVCSFELTPTAGIELPAFTAGAHVDVYVAPGLIRQYSLCNPPQERSRYLIAVLQEPTSRGGSKAMHAGVTEGSSVQIGAPRNLFELDMGASHYLLFAGGIGITPILAMAYSLAAVGKSFELHYCGRSIERLAFVEQIRATPWGECLRVHVDNGPEEQRLNAASVLASPSAGDQLYVCGPTGFMNHVLDNARASGWSETQLHREDFAAAPQVHENDQPFKIELTQSGQVLVVPAQRTALEVLLEHGVQVESSCEQGICGACITRVLEGSPDHRDQYMTDVEHARNDCFTPCCSRSHTPRLVLDL